MPDGCKKLDPCRRGCWWWSEVLVVVASILASGCVTRSVCSNLVAVVLSQSQGTNFGSKKHGQGVKGQQTFGGYFSIKWARTLWDYLGIILASIPPTWNCRFVSLPNHYPFSSFSPWFVETKFFESLRCSWKEPCCWWILLALWTAFLGPCPWVSFWAWMKCCTSVGLPWQKMADKRFWGRGKIMEFAAEIWINSMMEKCNTLKLRYDIEVDLISVLKLAGWQALRCLYSSEKMAGHSAQCVWNEGVPQHNLS